MEQYKKFLLEENNHQIYIVCRDCDITHKYFVKGNGDPMGWNGYTFFAILAYLDLHNTEFHSELAA